MRSKAHLTIITALVLFLSSCSWHTADIHEIQSINEAQWAFSAATQNSLLVFDIDQTIANPTEQLFNLLYIDIADFALRDHAFIHNLRANSQVLRSADKDFCNEPAFVSALFSAMSFVPVEQQTIELIKEAQQRGVKVIALTAVNPGPLGTIPSMEQWRVDTLAQLGLDFSTSFTQERITFQHLRPRKGHVPMYYRGVLCASRMHKGIVLAAFLDEINWNPENIFFFDDTKEQCFNIRSAMKKRNIPTECFWYRAAFQEKIAIDQTVIQQQINHWEAHKEFLSTQEILSAHPM